MHNFPLNKSISLELTESSFGESMFNSLVRVALLMSRHCQVMPEHLKLRFGVGFLVTVVAPLMYLDMESKKFQVLQSYKQCPYPGYGLNRTPHIIFTSFHDDVIKWKHFPCYWPFVKGIHRSPVNSPHKGQWRGALMFSLKCAWTNGWVHNRDADDLRRHRAHYDVTAIWCHSEFLMDIRDPFINIHPGCFMASGQSL